MPGTTTLPSQRRQSNDPALRPSPQGPPEEGVPVALMPVGGDVVDGTETIFRWTAVPGARTYRVQISPETRFGKDRMEFLAYGSTCLQVFDRLPTDGETVFWRVEATDGGAPGAWSSVEAFRPSSPETAEQHRAREEERRREAEREAASAGRGQSFEAIDPEEYTSKQEAVLMMVLLGVTFAAVIVLLLIWV
jgi:hypothetical protein